MRALALALTRKKARTEKSKEQKERKKASFHLFPLPLRTALRPTWLRRLSSMHGANFLQVLLYTTAVAGIKGSNQSEMVTFLSLFLPLTYLFLARFRSMLASFSLAADFIASLVSSSELGEVCLMGE